MIVSAKLLDNLVVPRFLSPEEFDAKLYEEADATDAGEDLGEVLLDAYLRRKKTWDKDFAEKLERELTLRIIDRNWTQQIDNMTRFRESVSLRSYAQVNPLQDYVNEGWAMFREMNETISLEVVLNLLNIKVEPKEEKKKETYTTSAPTAATSDAKKTEEPVAPIVKPDEDAKVVDTAKVETEVSVAAMHTGEKEAETVGKTAVEATVAKPEEKKVEANLNISDIDKDKKAADDVDVDKIHTN